MRPLAWSLTVAVAATLLTSPLRAQSPPADDFFKPVDTPRPGAQKSAEATPAPSPGAIAKLLEEARTEDAALRCNKLMAPSGGYATVEAMRHACAMAYIAHGDRIYALGSVEPAIALWKRAKSLHPPLGEDPALATRLNVLQRGEALPALAAAMRPSLKEATPAARVPCPACPQCPKLTAPPPCPKAPPCPKGVSTAQADSPPGPRAGRSLGVGFGFGYDGLASLVLSWMHDEFLAIEASVGAIFPTLDARVRFYGMRTPVTPVLGVGMLTPFGSTDYFDAEIEAGFPELYGHGAAIHVDLGVSYAPWPALDIYAGVSFLTTLDGEVEMLVFFPHWAVQTMFYF